MNISYVLIYFELFIKSFKIDFEYVYILKKAIFRKLVGGFFCEGSSDGQMPVKVNFSYTTKIS